MIEMIQEKRARGRPRKPGGSVPQTPFRVDLKIMLRLDRFVKQLGEAATPGTSRFVTRSTTLNDILSYFFGLVESGKISAETLQDCLRRNGTKRKTKRS